MNPGPEDKSSSPLILVIDDDRGLVRLMEKSLQRGGFQSAKAHSAAQAIQWLEEHRPSLMLLDLKLPDMDGKELIQHLAQIGRSFPFIIITGQGDERVAVEMMKRGAMDYLVKDVRFQEFVPAVVRRALDQLEKERRLASAEEALKREHAFLSAILNTSGALVAVLDKDDRFVQFNRACEQTTGYTFAEVRGKPVWDLIPPEETESVKLLFEKVRSSPVPLRQEHHWLTRSHQRRLIDWSNSILLNHQGQIQHLIATGIDITERKRLEKEILEISDREQRRIGQDLHDGLCQQLAALELMSEVLEQRLLSRCKSESERAGEIALHVRESINQARLLARGLSPVTVESDGLMAALQELCSNTERFFQVRCSFQCQTPVLIEDPASGTHLFRIAQEAVSNAIRHGKAREIQVTLEPLGSRLSLEIRDRGRGIPVPLEKHKGMGLHIMQYRARMIGGSLTIQRLPEGGTLIRCVLQQSLLHSFP
jgi:PAS domain S-box-containing protein